MRRTLSAFIFVIMCLALLSAHAFAQNETGQTELIFAQGIEAPERDSIELAAASSVTNCSMTLEFTVSATPDTAQNGYMICMFWGPDQNMENTASITTFGMYNSVQNNGKMTITYNNCVPGQKFYYRALMTDLQRNTLALGETIHYVELDSSLNGFEPLTLESPYAVNIQGRSAFYFSAPRDGMYAVEANDINSIQIKDDGGYPVVGEGGRTDYLFGTYVKGGQKLFITTSQNAGQAGSVAVYDGLGRLPGAHLGTQPIESSVPMFFQAPESGEYKFSVDNACGLSTIEENGDVKYQGEYYHTYLNEDQVLWLTSSYNPVFTVQLTVESGIFPTSVLTFPDSLTELADEACSGLPVEEVIFGSNIQSIGSKAFDQCADLQRVVIPVADLEIADDAFLACSSVWLVAPAGGNVEDYARTHFYVNFEEAAANP